MMVNLRLRCGDHCSGGLVIRSGPQVLVIIVAFFPVVAVGQEALPQIQIKTAADEFPQYSPAASELAEVSVAVIRVSDEGAESQLWNGDMGGVNPFRIPEPLVHPFHAFSPAALIGPVLNHGIAGQPDGANGFREQFWDLQGMTSYAQNSITILEGNSEDMVISVGQQPTSDVTMVITGHDGTDLTVSPSTLTFTSSDWADKTVTLTAGHDDDEISDELTLTITATQGSNENSVQRAVMIVDDEIIWKLTPQVVLEGSAKGAYIFLRDFGPPSGDVTFTVTGHEGTDLLLDRTKLTFPADNWRAWQRLGLQAKLDEDIEDDRVTLSLTAAGGGYDGLTYSLDVTIVDQPPDFELIPEGGSISFGLLLLRNGSRPQSDIVATYSGYEGTDLTVSPSRRDLHGRLMVRTLHFL